MLVFGLWLSLGAVADAAAESPDGAAAKVSVGIDGHYRVGRWAGLRVEGAPSIRAIETRDGDGVEVRYVQPVSPSSGGSGGVTWSYAVPGSEAAPLIVRDDSGVVVSTRFPTLGSPSRGAAMIPLEMPWLVVFGDPLGVDRIGANELLDRDALIAVSRPTEAAQCPDSPIGYDGVDMMMIGGSSRELLSGLSEQQHQAIADWVVDGGRLFLTLGETAPELAEAAPWLPALLGFDQWEVIRIDPSALETYTSSQTPLVPFSGLRLPKDNGRTLIMGRTIRRSSTPVAVEFNVGLGRVTVVAADLEDELFANWPERLDLITRLTGSILIINQDSQVRKNRTTAYNDLAGQLRSSLDQFKVKRRFGFSFVSLILMALIAAIGPLDYLVLNRVFGRPLLGWLTFPLVAIGLSAVLVHQSRPVVSTAADAARLADRGEAGVETNGGLANESFVRRCNRVEIIDIDSTLDVGRGFTVNYLYSHEATRLDVTVTESDTLLKMIEQPGSLLTAPFGYPGPSFGGIQIAIEDSRLPRYEVPLQRVASGQSGQWLRSKLVGVPLASRSSKGIMTRSRFVPKLTAKPLIERRPGSELLRGELINPLPVDLLNGMLIYRNWTYILPTRFPVGGRVATIESLRQKNFRWHLSRQKTLETETETEPWDPANLEAVDRIAEMLMFHEAVGGSRYTNLEDGPLSFLDLSHVLTEDRCILLGRIADPATRFESSSPGEPAFEPGGERLTFLRVVLPVIDRQPGP
jgi:hypothetical protein